MPAAVTDGIAGNGRGARGRRETPGAAETQAGPLRSRAGTEASEPGRCSPSLGVPEGAAPPQPRKHSQTGSQQSLGPGVPREDPWAYGTRRHPSHGWARGPRGLGRGASWGAVSVTVRSDKIAQSPAACDYLLEANGCFNINGPQAAFGERRPEPRPGCLRRQEVPPPPHGANTAPEPPGRAPHTGWRHSAPAAGEPAAPPALPGPSAPSTPRGLG